MKLYSTILFLFLALFSSSIMAHEETQKVALEPELFSNQAGHITYEFQLIDLENKTLIKDSDLTVENEKLLHFIAYDSALKEFQHLHPIYTGKNWVIEFDLKRNGDYWIWAQGQLSRNKTDFSSSNKLSIMGGIEANPLPAKLQLTRSGNDSISSITLSSNKIIAKKEVMLNLKFLRTDGTTAIITNYLGAMAHVIAVTDDGDSITHVHVMNASKINEGMVHSTFATSGKYRLWIQFLDNNILRTVPLAVEVF
ncbi:MAG: hypothetical protein H7281_11385 [Bacteriovorax sp.]|nr:hypothetical protein [Bacteriovorax sp.]